MVSQSGAKAQSIPVATFGLESSIARAPCVSEDSKSVVLPTQNPMQQVEKRVLFPLNGTPIHSCNEGDSVRRLGRGGPEAASQRLEAKPGGLQSALRLL